MDVAVRLECVVQFGIELQWPLQRELACLLQHSCVELDVFDWDCLLTLFVCLCCLVFYLLFALQQ